MLCGSSQGGCLGSENGWGWTVEPLGLYAHHEDMGLGHEAETAMTTAPAIVTLTEDHTRHVAEKPHSWQVLCLCLYSHQRYLEKNNWENKPCYLPSFFNP